ncbi:mammalian cell entry protein [Mycobacterium sp. E740]|nr:mammalian cell entry protein [Mycobacterium sp. E740]
MTTGAQPSEAAEPVEQTAAEPRRRRRWFRRGRPETHVAEPDTSVDQSAAEDEVKSAPRPVGKANRGSRTRVSEPAGEPRSESDPAATQTDSAAAESDSAAAKSDSAATESDVVPQEVRFVPHRPAGRRWAAATVVAAVLFVGAAGFAGATLQPYLAERAEIATKLDVARTAASAISTLWTYTPDNMETLPDRSAVFLGGDFAYEYRKYIDAIVATNKQAQVTNTTQVLGAAVESLAPSEATAIVYTNSVATSPMTKNIPSLRYLSYRLTMERRDAKWLITRMSTITSLDLTPQL